MKLKLTKGSNWNVFNNNNNNQTKDKLSSSTIDGPDIYLGRVKPEDRQKILNDVRDTLKKFLPKELLTNPKLLDVYSSMLIEGNEGVTSYEQVKLDFEKLTSDSKKSMEIQKKQPQILIDDNSSNNLERASVKRFSETKQGTPIKNRLIDATSPSKLISPATNEPKRSTFYNITEKTPNIPNIITQEKNIMIKSCKVIPNQKKLEQSGPSLQKEETNNNNTMEKTFKNRLLEKKLELNCDNTPFSIQSVDSKNATIFDLNNQQNVNNNHRDPKYSFDCPNFKNIGNKEIIYKISSERKIDIDEGDNLSPLPKSYFTNSELAAKKMTFQEYKHKVEMHQPQKPVFHDLKQKFHTLNSPMISLPQSTRRITKIQTFKDSSDKRLSENKFDVFLAKSMTTMNKHQKMHDFNEGLVINQKNQAIHIKNESLQQQK